MTETTNHCQKSFKTSVEMQPFLDDSVYWLHGHGYSWNILRWPGWLVQQRPRHAKLDPYIEDSPGLKTWRKLASVDSCQRLHSLHLRISYIYIYIHMLFPHDFPHEKWSMMIIHVFFPMQIIFQTGRSPWVFHLPDRCILSLICQAKMIRLPGCCWPWWYPIYGHSSWENHGKIIWLNTWRWLDDPFSDNSICTKKGRWLLLQIDTWGLGHMDNADLARERG